MNGRIMAGQLGRETAVTVQWSVGNLHGVPSTEINGEEP